MSHESQFAVVYSSDKFHTALLNVALENSLRSILKGEQAQSIVAVSNNYDEARSMSDRWNEVINHDR